MNIRRPHSTAPGPQPVCRRWTGRRLPLRPAAAVVLWSVLLALAGCGSPAEDQGPTAAEAELREVPEPNLERAEEAVRQQIADQRRALDTLASAGDPADLGEAYGELGLLYLTYSFLEAAEVCFDNARVLRAGDTRWPYLLGYLFQIQGRLEEAVGHLEKTLELEPDHPQALLRLGQVRLELDQIEAAGALFERVLAQDPSSAAALDGLGKVAAASGDPARAVEYFERALEAQPTANSIYHALGLAYRDLGEIEKARTYLERGGDAPVLFADPVLSSVVELGRSAELYLVRAAQAFSEKRYHQAEGFYRKALELDPTDFTTHKALGFCLEKLGDVDGAVAQLEEAMRVGTTGDDAKDRLERSELYRILGGLRVLQGRDPEAIAAFRQSLELDPERFDSRSKLANALARRGDLEEALEHYDRLLEAEPELAQVRVRRATALINVGRSQAAKADFERAINAAPDDAEIRIRFAEALEFLGEERAAADQRATAAELAADPRERGRLLADEADRRLRRGQVEAALELYQKVLSLDTGNTDARYQLATVLGHLGRFDEAVREFEQVVDAAPHHGPARRGELTALLLQDRFSAARERLEDGMNALPRDLELAHAMARLLATAPDAAVRDGELALRIASRVHQEARRADTAETLAAALAESGRFVEAAGLQSQLVSAAEQARRRQPERWRQQLLSYERSQPWRSRSADELIAALQPASGDGGTGR